VDSLPGKRFLHVRELPGATIFQLSREYQQGEQWPMLIPYERGSQVEFYVLDKAFQPVPIGITGELFIAVSNRQRGYAASAELTAAAFVPNPFSRPMAGCNTLATCRSRSTLMVTALA
jgi:non-ribosomal peptide synthetase component F